MNDKDKKAFVARMKKWRAAHNAKYNPKKPKRSDAYHRKKLKELGYTTRTINKFLRERKKLK